MAGRIVRGTSIILAGRVVSMATKGVLILLLTRFFLDPAEYGLLFLTISVLGVAMLFANLGFAKSGARYVAEYGESNPELVPTVVRKTLLLNALAIAAVCVVLYLLRDTIAAAVGAREISALLGVGVGYVVATSLKSSTETLFQGFNRMGWVTVTNVLNNVLLLGAVPAFLLLGFGLGGVISGYTVSAAVAAVVGLAVMRRGLDAEATVSEKQSNEVTARVVRYSVPLTLTRGANTIDSRADTILLGVFRGPASIAFYTLGKQIADFLIAPAQSLGFAISPTYGEEKASGDLSRAAELYERSFVYTVAFYGPAAAGVALVAEPAVGLIFGPAYVGAGPILQIFSLFVFVRVLDKITNDALDFLGRAQARAAAKGSLSLANIVLNLLLIPPFGAIGATVATVATYTVLVGIELYVIVDELPIDIARLLRACAVVGGITVGTSLIVYPLAGFISDIPTLVGVIVVGGTVWFALTVAAGLVDLRRVSSAIP